MRYLFTVVCLFFLISWATPGAAKQRNSAARTEVDLMTNVLKCMRAKDSLTYYNLFPPFDTLWKLVMHNTARTPEAIQELGNLREHPTILIDLDPFYNHGILGRFTYVLRKAEDSGLQWGGIVMQRYELQKQGIPHGMEGLQHIAPERFRGFLFVRDMLSSTTYCITITEIMKINGYFYGGQVLNALEANTIDDYLFKEEAERKYLEKMRRKALEPPADSAEIADSIAKAAALALDSARADTGLLAKNAADDTAKARKNKLYGIAPAPDDESGKTKKEIVDRKYYKGKFDDEITVELYIRYMRNANGKVTQWDALYKFGDMQEYVKLEVSKTKEGLWVMEEPAATLELELGAKTYTGSWTNGVSQTGYDAELAQAELSQEKILEMDYILENGVWGKTSEQKISEPDDGGSKRKKKRKAEKDDDDDGDAKPKSKPKPEKKDKDDE